MKSNHLHDPNIVITLQLKTMNKLHLALSLRVYFVIQFIYIYIYI